MRGDIMDLFGIGNAIRGAMLIYFRASRRTGRTTALIDALQDGDMVVFATHKLSHYFERRLREERPDINVKLAVVNPKQGDFSRLTACEGRMYFDHVWLEEFYLHRQDEDAKQIKWLQNRYSNVEEPKMLERQEFECQRWLG